MPCYSIVTKTKMTDAARIAEALAALGYTNIDGKLNVVSGRIGAEGMLFTRRQEGAAFQTTNLDADRLKAIQRKYAEIGVRAWAKRSGYSVTENDGRSMTLINRRKG